MKYIKRFNEAEINVGTSKHFIKYGPSNDYIFPEKLEFNYHCNYCNSDFVSYQKVSVCNLCDSENIESILID
jgi:hypothetical protein